MNPKAFISIRKGSQRKKKEDGEQRVGGWCSENNCKLERGEKNVPKRKCNVLERKLKEVQKRNFQIIKIKILKFNVTK